jgi:Tol biopolymer transport system component
MIVDPANGSTTILDVREAPIDLALICRAWSPDDDLLLCQGDSFSAEHPESNGVYSIRSSDGSDLTRLTVGAFPPVFTDQGTCGGGDQPGSYSPDGSRFVFTRTKCGSGPVPDRNQSAALYVADTDGGNLTQVTPYGVAWSHEEGLARWSPDGTRILFAGAKGNLFTIDPDGGHMKQIPLDVSGSRSFAIAPDWSPDGSKIVFNLFTDDASGIYTADADGGNLALIAADGPDFVNEPDWGAAAP